MSPAGAVLSAADGFRISGTDFGEGAAVASDGSGYLVTWAADDEETDLDVRGARVSGAGAVLDPSGVTFVSATWDQWQPDVAFDGTNYFVAWNDKRTSEVVDIYGTRVSPSTGAALDGTGLPLALGVGSWDDVDDPPALAFGSGAYLLVWSDEDLGDGQDIGGRDL